MSFIANNNIFNYSISAGVYTNTSSLLTALNTSISNAILGAGFTFLLLVSNTNQIIINTSGSLTTYSIIKNTLSNILNISTAINLNAGIYTSPYIYNLGYDTYIQMCFYNIP